MAYEPYNWTTASYVNPANMNHLEQGVAGASTTAEKAASDITKTNKDLSDLSGVVTTLNSKMNYSKSETLIGNFDGVPLYRKIVINNGTGERTVELGVNASKIKKVYVECVTSSTTTIPYYMSSTDYWNFYLSGTTLVYRGSNSFKQTNTLIIVIEYIK